MEQLAERIQSIDWKVRQLAKNMERLREEKAVLADENEQLHERYARQQDRLGVVRDKIKKIQRELTASTKKEEMNVSTLSNQINKYLKELDKSMEWVQNS